MSYWGCFKSGVHYIPGADRCYLFLRRIFGYEVPRYSLDRGAKPQPDISGLKRDFQKNPLCTKADTFALYRIIGNDLVPRHRKGQSRENLQFIIENEPDFPECEKRFVLNRIVDPGEEKALIRLLEKAGFSYLHIPFRWEEYKHIGLDVEGIPKKYVPGGKKYASLDSAAQGRIKMRLYRHKNNYVMNNNGARNAALFEGKALAKWVLPFDGNCFFTKHAWEKMVRDVQKSSHIPYFIVPMARITENERLLSPGFSPPCLEEPQILFRCDSKLFFNEDFFYGRRPKVELFWRLGVPGDWDEWLFEPWDLPGPAYDSEAGLFSYAGWVVRLDSGEAILEMDSSERMLTRATAIIAMLEDLDKRI